MSSKKDKAPAQWQGQSVFKLDLIAPNSGFKPRIRSTCAECKRLKIKCLRTESSSSPSYPCLTCIRRGCETICSQAPSTPYSSSGGVGHKVHRFRQSTTPQILEYQNTITALKRRVHELENALQDAHARLSDDKVHPLLRQSQRGNQFDRDSTPDSAQLLHEKENTNEHQVILPKEEEDTLVKAFGSLFIKEDGRSSYHAQNAGAWFYLQVSEEAKKTNPDALSEESDQTGNEPNNTVPHYTATKPLSLSAILTPDILYASRIFPMGAIDDADISSQILMRIQGYLPDREEALKLVDSYYSGSSWLYDPISYPYFMSAIFNVIYPTTEFEHQVDYPSSNSLYPLSPTKTHPHPPSYSLTLANLFIILAIGLHLDVNRPCGSPATNIYYHLARAAVASDWVENKCVNATTQNLSSTQMGSATGTGMPACLLEPGLDVVRVLLLMGYYLHMSDAQTGPKASWAIMGLATKLATGIGLHRDPTKWNLDPVESRLRQELFWELYTYDSWQSMPNGRPPSFLRSVIDLKRPYEPLLEKYRSTTDLAKIDRDEILDIFKAWKHHFCFLKIGPTVEQAWGANIPSYYTILILDRVLREHLENIPVLLRLPSESGTLPSRETGEYSMHGFSTQSQNRYSPDPRAMSPPISSGNDGRGKSYISLDELDKETKSRLTMQRYTSLFFTHDALLLMHRPFFLQALNMTNEPLMSKFAASVLAVYRSSCMIVTRATELSAIEPRLSPRIWFFWAEVFSAVTCLGGLALRCPNLSLASSALAHIELACDLFERLKDSNRAVGALPTMIKLRDKARLALNTYHARRSQNWSERGTTSPDLQGRSRGRNEGPHSSQRNDGSPNIPVPILKEEEKDEISALVGQTRLVDRRTGKSHPNSNSSSNAQSPSNSQSRSSPSQGSFPTSSPPSLSGLASTSSTLMSAAVSGSDPNYFVPEDTKMLMPDAWTQSGTGFGTLPFPSDPEVGFRDQAAVFSQTGTSQQSCVEAQWTDPFSLFRQLGLDIAIPDTSNEAALDSVNPYTERSSQIPNQTQVSHNPVHFQFPIIGSQPITPQRNEEHVEFNVNTNNIQPQDTDAAFENFIAQAMKGYGTDINSFYGTADGHPGSNPIFGIGSHENSKPNTNNIKPCPNDTGHDNGPLRSFASSGVNPTSQRVPISNNDGLSFRSSQPQFNSDMNIWTVAEPSGQRSFDPCSEVGGVYRPYMQGNYDAAWAMGIPRDVSQGN